MIIINTYVYEFKLRLKSIVIFVNVDYCSLTNVLAIMNVIKVLYLLLVELYGK